MSRQRLMRGTVRSTLILSALLLAFSVSSAQGQAPDGYILTEPVLLPDTLYEEYLAGSFTVSILRRARDSVEVDLIRIAESLYPVSDSIVAAGERYLDNRRRLGSWPRHLQEAAEAPGPRWWWHRWGRVWLPYALTGAAVHHYVSELRGLARDPYGEPGMKVTGRFEYRAAVDVSNGFPVVQLEMRWEYHCGRLCGLWFSHGRRIYFAEDGTVTRIEGDAAPSFVVS